MKYFHNVLQIVITIYEAMANSSCLIPFGKSSLVSKVRQCRPFFPFGVFMVCPFFVMYESSFDVWGCIGNLSQVHVYDIFPCVIACIFCCRAYQRSVTRCLIVIRIPLDGRLESNHQNRSESGHQNFKNLIMLR